MVPSGGGSAGCPGLKEEGGVPAQGSGTGGGSGETSEFNSQRAECVSLDRFKRGSEKVIFT